MKGASIVRNNYRNSSLYTGVEHLKSQHWEGVLLEGGSRPVGGVEISFSI